MSEAHLRQTWRRLSPTPPLPLLVIVPTNCQVKVLLPWYYGPYRAELVIGADGSRSAMSKLLNAPQTLPLTFAGHSGWRGTVPVRDVSKEMADFFGGNACFDLLGNKSYVIPPNDSKFGHDDVLLNWLLYQDLEEGSDEEAVIFTDKHGRRTQRTVGRGLLDPKVWEMWRAQLTARIVASFAELVNKSPMLLVAKISKALGSQTRFYGVRVVLVDDVLASYRPNLGRATDQAAAHCLALAEVLQNGGNIDDGKSGCNGSCNRHVCRENEKALLLSRVVSEARRGTWCSLSKAIVDYVKFHRRKQ